ncbi:MAG: ammonium transporter [Henriciella sp.]|uniref:ammonium transporter n=1 Tax=Henriciella sp. TaxID=1968823 RepID=UPI000C0CE388|nr:ammonium transporter [Henriciella sp.]MAN75056.1 ammonium transporter [Henriciella sp.]MBK76850.1 ammonium transporter [Henriciella sp.]PHR74782.1 MAG: ammonium transporter [Henriciella sp.]
MNSMVKRGIRGLGAVSAVASLALGASAQDASAVGAYVDNSYLFLIGGLIVMFMAAGFCMLEAGLVRKKNAAMQSMKNVALFSVAGIMFWLVGYNMAYPGSTIAGWVGIPAFIWSPEESLDTGYAASSDWFFQMVFVATAASIVSGTVAERVKLWPFLIFTAVLTAFIYPIVASWEWGGGALDSQFAFSDFAGSTLVHSTGGWAALVGAIIIGPRAGKFVNGTVHPMPGSNIPLAALGTFILWFGWFGFNGASQLAAGTFDDINAVANIFANTNMAACGGVLAAMILTGILYKGKVDATMAFNGAIGGLVSITAEPLMPSMGLSILIGAIGGVLVVLTVPLLDKLKIDDVVGAIPAHLVCGIWGTMIVPLSHANDIGLNEAGNPSYVGQFIGVLACAIFVSVASAIVWFVLKATVGVRPTEEEEIAGMDKSEVGLEAYPEFG